MKDGNCIIVERCPIVEEYQRLRQRVGWSNINTKAIERAKDAPDMRMKRDKKGS